MEVAMENLILELKDSPSIFRLIISITILLIVLTLKAIIFRQIRKNRNLHLGKKRRWSINTNTTLTFIFIISLIIVWEAYFKSVAISFLAIAVPLVLATKELLMCISGSFLKLMSGEFSIGDRVEFNGIRGDVIGRSLLTVKILEIGPKDKTHQYTGRSITIPNSLFLSKEVINESYLHDFVLHTFTIPLSIDQDWEEAERVLLDAAAEECSQFYDSAQKYMDRIQSKRNLITPAVKPRVHIRFVDPNEIQLIIRISVPAQEKGKIEQRIVRKYLKRFATLTTK